MSSWLWYRSWIPNWVEIKDLLAVPGKAGEYTPWIVAHESDAALSDERLTALVQEFKSQPSFNTESDSLADEFSVFLEGKGYHSEFVASEPGVFVAQLDDQYVEEES